MSKSKKAGGRRGHEREGRQGRKALTFDDVRAIGVTLPGVEVSTSYGSPSLKVGGKMFVCIAVHKSAEPNTLAVLMDFVQRDALLEEEPGTYYLKDHYVGYPCILVRLSRVHPDALRDLVRGAHRFVAASGRAKKRSRR